MTITTTERKTLADYTALEEGAPYQLIDGELIMSPSPIFIHQKLVGRLFRALSDFLESKGLGGEALVAPMDVYLSETEAYQPDVLYISPERSSIIRERVHGAPDLVMEVLSPSTAYYDLTKKKRVYALHGVQEYWIVDPFEKTIEVLENRGGYYHTVSSVRERGSAESRLLEGFAVEAERLFGSLLG